MPAAADRRSSGARPRGRRGAWRPRRQRGSRRRRVARPRAERAAERVNQIGGNVRVRKATGWWRLAAGTDAALEGNRFALEALGEGSPEARSSTADPGGGLDPSHRPRRVEHRPRPRDHRRGRSPPRCVRGPYTSIGNDVVIEGAEIEHSIVMLEASIRHLGGRLEASVIGPECARVPRLQPASSPAPQCGTRGRGLMLP